MTATGERLREQCETPLLVVDWLHGVATVP